jgi:hypothetical protein
VFRVVSFYEDIAVADARSGFTASVLLLVVPEGCCGTHRIFDRRAWIGIVLEFVGYAEVVAVACIVSYDLTGNWTDFCLS